MTHAELVARAYKWLLNTKSCAFAFRELGSVAGEIPDAIGWRDGFESHLIECKATRSDFLADGKKHFRRRPEKGQGMFRYMMCPSDIIKPEEVPYRWGLLYCLPKTVRVIVKPQAQTNNHKAEIILLASALRRVHLRGDLEKIYDPDTLRKAG